MTRAAPRGWRSREQTSAVLDSYQAVCGHYLRRGIYACVDCNIGPLSDLLALDKELRDLIDSIQRGTPDDINRTVSRGQRLLDSMD